MIPSCIRDTLSKTMVLYLILNLKFLKDYGIVCIDRFSTDLSSLLNTEVIDEEKEIYRYKIVKPNSVNYLYFSKTLKKQQLESKARKILRMIEEAKEIQESIDKKKKIPKRFLNNVLIDVSHSIQTIVKNQTMLTNTIYKLKSIKIYEPQSARRPQRI